jgi:tetratricopeptide (TPR) repeat protein
MKAWEEPLAVLTARLQVASATDDIELFLGTEALAEALRVIELLERDDDELPAWFALGWFFWYRLLRLDVPDEGRREFEAAIEMFSACFVAGTDTDVFPEPLLSEVAVHSSLTAITRLQPESGHLDQDVIAEAVGLLRRALNVLPDQHPARALMLSNLAVALQTSFRYGMAIPVLDEAISLLQSAVSVVPAGNSDLPDILSNLSTALYTRHVQVGRLADLLGAVEAAERAVDAVADDDPGLGGHLGTLAVAQLALFERTDELAHLDEAIDGFVSAVAVYPAGSHKRAGLLTNLGVAFRQRFERTGEMADLENAIAAGRDAVRVTPADHSDYAIHLTNYSVTLATRFERTGVARDLDDAIEFSRHALWATPEEHASRTVRLAALGQALMARAGRTGDTSDVDEAIEVCREAVRLTPLDHPDVSMHLNNLAVALWNRFEWAAELAVLDEAVEVGREAVRTTPGDHPDLGSRLSNAGLWLWARYRRAGRLSDLDEAVDLGERAVAVIPDDHPEQSVALSNLSIALKTRFDRTGTTADLAAAVEAGRAAADVVPDGHSYAARYRSNLAGFLAARYGSTGDIADLDAAAAVGQAAVAVAAADDVYRPRYLSTLGAILATRHSRTGLATHLDAAIQAGRDAVEAASADYPERASYLLNLGHMLRTRFELSGGKGDVDDARSVFESAAAMDSARPSDRILAARAAAKLIADSDAGKAVSLLETAVRLLPEVAPRRLGRSDQQHALEELAGLAGDAAAFALSAPGGLDDEARAWRAVRLLEAGRAFMLNQALDTRGDLSELRRKHPGVAARFEELRNLLDQDADPAPGHLGTVTTPDRHLLAEELAATLARIRAHEEFASFGLPPTHDELIAETSGGPIVCFNVTSYRSDALVLADSRIACLSLPDLTEDALTGQVNEFYDALAMVMGEESGLSDRRAAELRLFGVLSWLWDVVASPVLSMLGLTDKSWPRVWWVTGGLLGLLPVHAAGHHADAHTTAQRRRAVMDRVTSSYTPTIRALGHARKRRDAMKPPGRALIVAMPTTPGVPGRLRHVPVEAGKLRSLLPDSVLLIEGDGPDGASLPTKATVLAHLEGCTIAHFACHGVADPVDPSKSRLLLNDHDTDPFTVASLVTLTLARAGLAYLSACRTAFSGAVNLLDEAIHLASAFQLIGFPHVIGTLWEVDDEKSTEIALMLYENLRADDGTFDLTKSPCALHRTIRAMRDRFPATPSLWAAYLYAGA